MISCFIIGYYIHWHSKLILKSLQGKKKGRGLTKWRPKSLSANHGFTTARWWCPSLQFSSFQRRIVGMEERKGRVDVLLLRPRPLFHPAAFVLVFFPYCPAQAENLNCYWFDSLFFHSSSCTKISFFFNIFSCYVLILGMLYWYTFHVIWCLALNFVVSYFWRPLANNCHYERPSN